MLREAVRRQAVIIVTWWVLIDRAAHVLFLHHVALALVLCGTKHHRKAALANSQAIPVIMKAP